MEPTEEILSILEPVCYEPEGPDGYPLIRMRSRVEIWERIRDAGYTLVKTETAADQQIMVV